MNIGRSEYHGGLGMRRHGAEKLLDNSIKLFRVVCTISVSFSPCLDVHLLEVAGEGEGTKSDRGEEGDKGDKGEEGDEGNHIKGAACRVTSWKFVLRTPGFSLSLNIWHIIVIDCPLTILNLIALDFLNTYSTLQHAALEGEIGSEACTTLRFLGFRALVWIQPYAVSIRLRDICSYVGWRVVILFWVCQPCEAFSIYFYLTFYICYALWHIPAAQRVQPRGSWWKKQLNTRRKWKKWRRQGVPMPFRWANIPTAVKHKELSYVFRVVFIHWVSTGQRLQMMLEIFTLLWPR